MPDSEPARVNTGLSRRGFLSLAGVSALPLAASACGESSGDPYPSKELHIMAPAAAGGGWDLTAKAIATALKDSGLAKRTEAYDVEGGSGITGLTQFVHKNHGDPYQLMVTGLVMIGGIVNGATAVGLSQVNEIATLTTEQELIVVPKGSRFTSLSDLMDAANSDPKSITWGGGSAGGTDEILVLLLADAAGADPKKMVYRGASGGGESRKELTRGSVDVGVSGVSEYRELVKSGAVRPLAVSGKSGAKVAGVAVPTCKSQGVNVELMNWRGVVAPAGIAESEIKDITHLIARLAATKEWKKQLSANGWDDFLKTGAEAKRFYGSETDRVAKIFAEVGKS